MSLYDLLVIIHRIAAVCGLPFLPKGVKTVSEAKHALVVNDGIEKLVKIGSIIILITWFLMGALNTHLFTQIWYLASIGIYIVIQLFVAYLIPKKLKLQKTILSDANTEEIPNKFHEIGKQMVPLNGVAHFAVFVLIIRMILKPF